MLFDVRPKEDRRDLYDRERELSELRESIERGVWSAVYGVRRVGKTSVANVAVNDPRYIAVKVNLVRLYDPKRRRYSRSDFVGVFLEGVNDAVRRYTLGGRVVRFISNVLGIDEESFLEFNVVKIRARLRRFRDQDVNSVIRELDQLAKDNGKRLVIVLDEAQELMKVNGLNLPSILHDVYDYCRNTVIIFAGSMIGLMEGMLKGLEYDKPFFGRLIRRIRVDRFTEDQSRDFLRRGFEEEGIRVGEDVIDDAVRRFDGIVGWLTFFGAEYSFRVKHGESVNLDEIERMAINEVREEFKSFLVNSQSPERYSAVVIALDRLGGRGTLGEVTKVVNELIGEVPEPRVYEILNRLVNMGFIEKVNDEYVLPRDTPNRKGMLMASKEVINQR
ncbi:MAG: ATP-binding protein [Vulcanisaeta sp.]